ncbi:putative hemerythrin, Thioredoxin-like superfamily [Dioscorea sansibarensis]
MGNCAPKPKRSSPPRRRSKSPVPATMTFQLFGSESCPIAARIRISLLYKNSTFQFIPSESPILRHPVLRCGSQSISGSADMILRYIDSTFPGSPSFVENGIERSSVAAELGNAVGLQHRSIERHLEGVARWAEEIANGGGGGRSAAGRKYAELVEIMLEHAQMEERFLFPLLELAAEDRGTSPPHQSLDPKAVHLGGLCGVAYEEHAKELPMMNGIKEDMKSVMAMGPKAPCYQEAMLNLSQRLKTLQVGR